MNIASRLLAAFAAFATFTLPAAANEYTIDDSHTYAHFTVDHLGFSTQRGFFGTTSGSIRFDPETRSGEVDVRIAAASLETGNRRRDDALRGATWFNVEAFPDILLRHGKLIFEGDRPVAVEGTLVLLGEARPLRLEITRFKCGLNLAIGKTGCGADAHGRIRRSEFGMNSGIPFVGDEVRLDIQVEAYSP